MSKRKYPTKPYLNDVNLKYNEENIVNTQLGNVIVNNITTELYKINDTLVNDSDPENPFLINSSDIKNLLDVENNIEITKNCNNDINEFNNTKYVDDTNCKTDVIESNCDDFKNGINYDKKISNYFTLGQLSSNAVVSKYYIRNQKGLTKEQIACNLKILAENVLDKIKIKYSNMYVTSGFRCGYGGSQHYKGQAVDMQFQNLKNKDYIKIADWIKNNVDYDQLLLEYKSFGSKKAWIHISYNNNSNRNMDMTLFNNRTYKHNLIDMAGNYGIPV